MDHGRSRRRYADHYFETRDGLRLHYRDYAGSPDRPPLLCLPGLTRNARDFDGLANRVSPRFRVLALDFRGRGDSDNDPVPARYTPLVYAGDVLALLDHLGIDEAVFVGTSLGGLVTMIVAASSLQRIAASILNDVGPELDQAGLDHIQTYLGRDLRFGSWEEAADAVAAVQAAAFPDYGREDWLAMARRNCREDENVIRFDYDMAVAEPFKASGPTPKIDLWPFFLTLAQKPLLVVRGELSALLSEQSLGAMHSVAPGMTSVTVPRVGHPPTLDEPAAVAAIDAFLENLGNQ